MHTRSFLISAGSLLLGCVLWGGCASGSSSSLVPRQTNEGGAVGSDATAFREPQDPAADDPEAARLAAIEDFLARTAEYDTPHERDSGAVRTAEAGDIRAATTFAQDVREDAIDQRESIGEPGSGTSRAALSGRDKGPDESATANERMSLPGSAPVPKRRALPTLLSVSLGTDPVSPAERRDTLDHQPARVTNVPIDVGRGPDAFEFEDWLMALEREADNGGNLAAEWKLRLIELAVGRDVSFDDIGSRLSAETRSLLANLYQAVGAVRELAANPLSTGEAALAQVEALRATLAQRADPVIATVALCRRVVTFGVFDEMEPDSLIAGREIQTIVYSEVENLQAVRTEDARFETRLATRLELFSTDGTSVWLKEEPEIVDVCRRRRHDFFIAQRITVPPTIPAGEYILKVGIEDRNAGRAAEYTMPLTIQAPLSVARGG